MGMNMAALEKILGKGKGMVSRVGKESGNMLGAVKDGGKGVMSSLRNGRGQVGATTKNLGIDAANFGRKAKENPFGTAALGAGAAGAAGAGAYGIKELLESLEDDDMDDMIDNAKDKARGMGKHFSKYMG
jgi:hypothetical protein